MIQAVSLNRKYFQQLLGLGVKSFDYLGVDLKRDISPKHMKASYEGLIDSSLREGIFENILEDGKLKAFFFLAPGKIGPIPITIVNVGGAQYESSKNWLLQMFSKYADRMDANTHVELPSYLYKLLPRMRDLGLNIDSVYTVGPVQKGLDYLSSSRGIIRSKFEKKGLFVRPTEEKDFQSIRRIEKREFGRNPQYGWFCGKDEFLDMQVKSRMQKLGSKDFLQFTLKNRRGTVKGYFYGEIEKNAVLKRSAGVSVVLDQSVQGLGVSNLIYSTLLKELANQKIYFYSGNTSHPAVLKKSVKMDRKIVNFCLRKTTSTAPQRNFIKLVRSTRGHF